MGHTLLRGRLAAAVAALVLVAAPLSFGATAASAAPLPPEVTSPAEGSYVPSNDFSSFAGNNATPGYSVEVIVDGESACFTESADDGLWSCETGAGSTDGPHTVVARQTVDEELSGTVVNYTVGEEPVPTLTVDDNQGDYALVAGDPLTLTGTMNPEASMTASMALDDGTGRIYWTCTNETSNWTCSLATTAVTTPGRYTLNLLEIIGTTDGEGLDTIHVTITAPAVEVPPVEEPPAEEPPVELPPVEEPPVEEPPVELPPVEETPVDETPVDVPVELPAETPAATPAAVPVATPATLVPAKNFTPVVAPRAPLVWTLTVGGVTGPLRPGQTVTLSSSGLPVGSTVSAELHSTPVSLGGTTVGSDGTFTLVALIPLTVEPGDHHFVVTVTEPGQEASVTETAVTIDPPEVVTAASEDSEQTDDPAVASALSLRGGAGSADRDAPGAPNSLSTSLAPAWEVLSSPLAIGTSVIAGLAFLVLVAFPSELLGAVIQRRYTSLHRVGRILPPGVGTWFNRHPVVSGVGAIALATLVTGFSDPGFGADVASVRLLVACFLAAIVVSYGTYVLLGWFLNRRWSLPTSLNLRPFTLIITIVGVVLSRVLDFSPGFLFGMMLSLTFPAATTIAVRSHARLLRTCLIVTIAIVSWFAYSGMVAVTGGAPTDFGSALLQDTLAALSTEGLTGMLIGMLPFLYLDGRDIWQHSKRSWAVVYALIVVVFFLVVAPKPTNWADLGDKYGPWAVVLGVYAAVALLVYVGFHRSELRAAARKQNVLVE